MDTATFGVAIGMYDCACAMVWLDSALTTGAGGVGMS